MASIKQMFRLVFQDDLFIVNIYKSCDQVPPIQTFQLLNLFCDILCTVYRVLVESISLTHLKISRLNVFAFLFNLFYFIFFISFFSTTLQSHYGTKRGAYQTSNERFYGIFTSSPKINRQTKSKFEKFRSEQISGHHMEVS